MDEKLKEEILKLIREKLTFNIEKKSEHYDKYIEFTVKLDNKFLYSEYIYL